MKEITVKNQTEFDALPDKFTEYTRIYLEGRISVNKARENSSVVARENSSVVARENSIVEARENSSVEAWENSIVVAWENSIVVARENSSVVAWENSSVVAWENSSVVAWENSTVVARENSSVEARGQALVRCFSSLAKLAMYGFSILSIPINIDLKFKYEKSCTIQRYETLKFLDREGIGAKKESVILFKRVSSDFKTQELTKNETLWAIGTTVTHPAWNPTKSECGGGKFHACSRPYFCDEFRSTKGDRYVAIKIKVADLYEWENATYPHKIAFRTGEVLYQCDRFGKEVPPC
ncbi:MAG: hypothetical protein WC750_06420 [Patescibacteria group bacterium]|jgi:hypothetical protein